MSETIVSVAWEKTGVFVCGTSVSACFTDPKRYVLTPTSIMAGDVMLHDIAL